MITLTRDQSEAIATRSTNALVVASAGSGKTEVLGRAVLEILADADQPGELDRLLVMTFTKAAAAELRIRVGKLLRAAIADRARPAPIRRHLRRQALRLESAEISTIDAWAQRVLREHFAAAEIDPGFRVLDPQEASLLRAAEMDELFAWVHTADDPVADDARAWMARDRRIGDGFLRSLVASLSRFREQEIDPDAWLARAEAELTQPATELIANAQAALAERVAARIDEVLGAPGAPDVPPPPEAAAKLARDLAAIREAARDEQQGLHAAIEEAASLPERKPKNSGAIGDCAKDCRKLLAAESVRQCDEAPVIAGFAATLIQLERRFDARLEAAKRRRSAYEFGDLLRRTLRVLQTRTVAGTFTPTAVARMLQERYTHVLVDEYQDTSPIQVALVEAISRPGPGNRFLVGDVKQSIYGFRLARPELFVGLQDDVAAKRVAGRLCPLRDNFRSHAALVDRVNAIFATLFARDFGGVAYDTQHTLVAGRSEVPNPALDRLPRVAVEIICDGKAHADAPHADAEDEADAGGGDDVEDREELERVEVEARLMISQLRTMFAAGVQIPQRTASGAVELRPLRYGDVVVLLRAAEKNAAHIARQLRDAGIPATTGGREALLAAREVDDVVQVLKLLIDPRDDVALASFLRGPGVELKEGELLALREARVHGPFCDAVDAFRRTAATQLGSRVEEAFAKLERWRSAARVEAPGGLVRRIIREGGILDRARVQRGAEHRKALLEAFARYADNFGAAGRRGVLEFVDHLEELQQGRAGGPEAATLLGEDAVRLMTIHASKGLEFPVVFVLNAGTKFNDGGSNAPLQCGPDGALGLRFKDYRTRTVRETPAYAANKELTKRRNREEELRLLYVAMTRARERLVVIGHATDTQWKACWSELARGMPLSDAVRMNAGSALSLLLAGLRSAGVGREVDDDSDDAGAAGSVPIRKWTREAARALAQPTEAPGQDQATGDAAPADRAAEDAWVEAGLAAINASPALDAARRPAVLSVSALKELTRRSALEEAAEPATALYEGAVPLARPAFAKREAGAADGRSLGTAVHRFLEHVDFAALESPLALSAARQRLVESGRLSAEEAALIDLDDLVWLGASTVGRILRDAHTVHRELAFVQALEIDLPGEKMLVRGVIDCIAVTSAGLVLVDYKTDQVRDAADFDERLRIYTTQVVLYRQVAERLLGQPVVAAHLAFLRLRRLEQVRAEQPDWRALFSGGGAGGVVAG